MTENFPDDNAESPAGWLFRGIRLTDGGRGVDEEETDLLIGGGRVKRIDSPLPRHHEKKESGDLRLIDGRGLWLWPGLVDAHVHFREPGFEHKENFLSGSRAAARGGYTSVICEPNTQPPLAFENALERAITKARKAGGVRKYFKAAMTYHRKGRRIADFQALSNIPEVVAFSDDGDAVSSLTLMEHICKECAPFGLPLSPHCEDSPRALEDCEAGVHPGFKPGAPYANESHYVERDADLALRYGCPIHFSHLSLGSSLNAISKFRSMPQKRAPVSCEVTPHHLLLSADDYSSADLPSVNPPLRSEKDMLAMRRALCTGHIDAVASDHAPHSDEEKRDGACGLVGLETTLGLIITEFVKPGRLSPLHACSLLSSNPAAIFGLQGGSITKGEPADLTVIDPDKRWVVDPAHFASRSRNTAFAGRHLTGKAIGTMCGGRFTYMDEVLRKRME